MQASNGFLSHDKTSFQLPESRAVVAITETYCLCCFLFVLYQKSFVDVWPILSVSHLLQYLQRTKAQPNADPSEVNMLNSGRL